MCSHIAVKLQTLYPGLITLFVFALIHL